MSQTDQIWQHLGNISDPEVPVISIVDLGIVRDIADNADGVEVTITPTYTGCPAMDLIRDLIKEKLGQEGYGEVSVKTVLTPTWTTDWLSDDAKERLRAYGIAPPTTCANAAAGKEVVACPRCGSEQTERVSQFGSTPCKASYKCSSCLEPFEHFKCL